MEALATLEADNVLLAAPAFNAAAGDACARLRAGDGAMVGVTFTHTPDQWLAAHADRSRERAGGLPADVWLVCVGEQVRSAAEPTAPEVESGSEVRVHAVSSAGNLTRLGVTLTECLPAAASAADAPTAALCFESAGTLFQHADAKSVCQFFQVLADHVSAHGVRAHYHVDPTAVGERDLGRLAVLFDALVDVSEAGEVAVRTR